MWSLCWREVAYRLRILIVCIVGSLLVERILGIRKHCCGLGCFFICFFLGFLCTLHLLLCILLLISEAGDSLLCPLLLLGQLVLHLRHVILFLQSHTKSLCCSFSDLTNVSRLMCLHSHLG